MVAGTSFVVAASAIGYVVLPARSALALTVRQDANVQDVAFYRRLPPAPLHPGPPHPPPARACPAGGRETIYGSVTAKGGAHLSDVTVEVDAVDGHGHTRSCGEIAVGPSGTYRSALNLAAGQYRVTVRYTVDHRHGSEARTTALRPGRSYEVSGVVRSARIFSFLPVSSY